METLQERFAFDLKYLDKTKYGIKYTTPINDT